MEKTIRKKKIIKFTNTKALRVGKGIKTLRERVNLSLKRLADEVGITQSYLNLLEEGHEPEVERAVLVRILEAGEVRCRYYTDEDLINIFLCISPRNPPEKLN